MTPTTSSTRKRKSARTVVGAGRIERVANEPDPSVVGLLLHKAVDKDQACLIIIEMIQARLPKDQTMRAELEKVRLLVFDNAQIIQEARRALPSPYETLD
jgi:hypothetical protein